MNKWLFLLIALMYGGSLDAQVVPDSLDRDQLVLSASTDNWKSDAPFEPQKKVSTHLSLGTSFTYSPNNFYGPSLFVAPSISYNLNPRLSLSAGIAVEHGNYYSLFSENNSEQNMLPMTRAFMYTRGSYQVSERLTVGGSAYKSINTLPQLSSYSRPYNYNYEGLSLDVNYKVSNAVSVGFQMRVQNNDYDGERSLIPPAGVVPGYGF